MKNIVMLQGMGINERGWAKMVSSFGRVVLIQQGMVTHVEVWESGERVWDGPETMLSHWRRLDDMLLGLPTALRVFFQTVKYTRGRKIDVIIASNYHNSLSAMMLKSLGKARKVVPFLTDYLPLRGSWFVRCHRRLTGWLMQMVSRWADEVWVLSPRIPTGRNNANTFVVPIGINEQPPSVGDRNEVAYIGFPSYDHALEILFAICAKHQFRLNVIGDSPYLQSIRHLAPPGTVFHGMLNNEAHIARILSHCFCGYAIYRDISPNSYSYYGFPSKTLYCFASNVPVVITNVADFNHTFEERGVGRVVEPSLEKIETAVLQLKEHYPAFSKAIDRFRMERNHQVLNFHRERFIALDVLPKSA
jgi:glycosyltransferase involved in cell wall biosynthesis